MTMKTNQKMSEGADVFICEAKLNFNLFAYFHKWSLLLNWRF